VKVLKSPSPQSLPDGRQAGPPIQGGVIVKKFPLLFWPWLVEERVRERGAK
jgi:hypothetical protein